MLETYKAKISDGILVWADDVPESVRNAAEADVIVTVVHSDAKKGRRPFGLARRRFTVPDDFDDPLPDEILREFDGG